MVRFKDLAGVYLDDDTGHATTNLDDIFKVGKLEGIKEVVEWMKVNRVGITYSPLRVYDPKANSYHLKRTTNTQLFTDEWEAKLKEWGID